MANNYLIDRSEIAATQTGATILDPGAGVGIVLYWIDVSLATGVEAEVWHGSAQTDTNTILHGNAETFIQRDWVDGLELPAGEVLKLTNGGATAKIVVGYALNPNA